MKCKNCAYFWKEENEDFSMCHWTLRCPNDVPPCEEENDNIETVDHEDYSEYDVDLI